MRTKITFLEASNDVKLVKTFTPGKALPYPLKVKRFTSHDHIISLDRDGLSTLTRLIKKHAAKGHCLFKGFLKAPIVNESRAGLTDRANPTNLLVLDIDGLEVDGTNGAICNKRTVERQAETAIKLLPDALQSASYIAQASSKFGMKKGTINLHLFFLLAAPINPAKLKQWLEYLNYTIPVFTNNLKLTATGMGLRYSLDRTVADNSKLIYIAPPLFDKVINPFEDDDERIVQVNKPNATLDISELVNAIETEEINKSRTEEIKRLRRKNGLSATYRMKMKGMTVDGRKVTVLSNPEQLSLEIAYENNDFVYYNVNGGDSNAYYHPIGRPDIVYNFKGEPPFEMKNADHETYQWYLETRQDEIKEANAFTHAVILRRDNDRYYKLVYDNKEDSLPHGLVETSRERIKDFYLENGLSEPDFIQTWDIDFNPRSDATIDFDKRYLNLFKATKLLLSEKPVPSQYQEALTYGMSQTCIKPLCPIIHKTLLHIVGDSELEYEHFINWLAYVVQYRDKTQTAWIFSGAPGTGKNIFVAKVLRPIFSDRHVLVKLVHDLDDRFDDWREQSLLTVVDEFQLTSSSKSTALLQTLKHAITEEYVSVRGMMVSQRQTTLYDNFIFLSNQRDALYIEENDRRFNVATRQELPIGRKYPNYRKEYHLMDDEVGMFCDILLNFDVDVSMARTCLENEQKRLMKEISMKTPEQFAHAISDGVLDFFIDVLDLEITDVQWAAVINTAKVVVTHWIKNAGKEIVVTSQELLTVYNAMNRSTLSQQACSKMLSRLGVEAKLVKQNGKPVRGVKTTFKLLQFDAKELLDSEEKKKPDGIQKVVSH